MPLFVVVRAREECTPRVYMLQAEDGIRAIMEVRNRLGDYPDYREDEDEGEVEFLPPPLTRRPTRAELDAMERWDEDACIMYHVSQQDGLGAPNPGSLKVLLQ